MVFEATFCAFLKSYVESTRVQSGLFRFQSQRQCVSFFVPLIFTQYLLLQNETLILPKVLPQGVQVIHLVTPGISSPDLSAVLLCTSVVNR